MDAVAEVQVVSDLPLAIDVEAVGVGKEPFVAGGRAVDQQDGIILRNRGAVQRDIACGGPDLVLRGPFVPQQLLERSGYLAGVILELLPLVGVVGEHDDRVADEFGHRLGARTAEHGGESGDLDVVEPPGLAVLDDFRLDEPADHVVLGISATLLDQPVVIRGRLHHCIHALGRG